MMQRVGRLKTYGQKLQHFVYEHHGRTQQQNSFPLDPVQWSDRENRLPTSRQRGKTTCKTERLTVRRGIYRMATCRTMLRVIAATRNIFFQSGRRSKLSFSDNEFIALNISTVTSIDKLIVDACRAMSFVNISHPISEK
jgi:hypothetical protein